MFRAGCNGREHFAEYLNTRGLKGYGIEIGTHRGEFAYTFLRHWRGHRLYCIDPYLSGYDDEDSASQGDREYDMHTAKNLLSRYGSRARFIYKTSDQAVDEFSDGIYSIAYIDGCHQPEFVKRDLRNYWPKLTQGGLLAGHDIVCPGEKDGGWGRFIQPIVIEFAKEVGRDVYLVPEVGEPWSYFLIK